MLEIGSWMLVDSDKSNTKGGKVQTGASALGNDDLRHTTLKPIRCILHSLC